ncbi:single-stranded-DNA-specific exonuclease RecJ [Limisalsivibrio acetivorans]|uniref:single-stranded-DNA-specific exonuclease RecJ n=1 Tax=Limisalsivibrio acetivorans TaxID=1304888 RepID=UPI0003B75998|nr:single-stranded-DNA-specific exonuclease RecJ [Limisalsivibrio acetivorans]
MKTDKVETYRSIKFRWRYESIVNPAFEGISELFSIPASLAEVFSKKKLSEEEQVNCFLDTPLRDLLNPFQMKDMDKAVKRIGVALEKNERICIYGDYDVDGVTSVSLLYLFLREVGAAVDYYIPNRLEEGYGLNLEAIDEIRSRGTSLIITVDCGINAVEQVEKATEMGIDVIVTDHHQPAEVLPDKAVAVVNPMQEDCPYPFKELAGVGVAFKLVMGLRYHLRENASYKGDLPNIKQYLDLVTLGTVADVVPILGENRIFVRHGLKILSEKDTRPGIYELKRVTGLEGSRIGTVQVGFALAPRINAVGRMGSSDKGLKLLITENRDEARYLARELDQENRFRQTIEKEIITESYDRIEKDKLHEKYKGLVLYSDEWHQGVIGIVASRIVEKFHKPTIIITAENGVGKGSARSIPAFHLYEGLKMLEDLLITFGGHKYAAGLKVDMDNISALQERFNEAVESTLTDEDFIPELTIDTFLRPDDINRELMEWLERMQPFGAGNKEPVFCMVGMRKTQNFSYVGKEKNHLKGYLEREGRTFDVIGYNMKEYEELVETGEYFDIVFSPVLNGYYGGRYIQLNLKDMRLSDRE